MTPTAPSEIIGSYLEDILSQPDLLAERFDAIELAIADGLAGASPTAWDRLVVAGCGDSHFAGQAARLALQTFTGLPVIATTSMDAGRYQAPFLNERSAVIAISVSGEASRTIEVLTLANAADATTIAVTKNAESRLGRVGRHVIATAAPPAKSHGPDARTFMMSLVTLYLTGIWLGERRGHLNEAASAHWRAELRRMSLVMADTLTRSSDLAGRIAETVADSPAFVSVGAGPNYGTALFTAAKILEGSGDYAWGQDAEEWAHLEYWIRTPDMPTILFAGPGRARSRIDEQVATMQRAGRRLVTVTEQGDPLAATLALYVGTGAPEVFSSLAHAIAGELFSFHLVVAKGIERYAVSRDDDSDGPSNNIRAGVIETVIETP
jgi:glutamine---fructose-6-phosphate transaminase (isomerizing)